MTNADSPVAMPSLTLTDPIQLTRELCDIPSESGAEGPLADLIETTVREYPHLQVDRDGDTIVARTNLGREHRVLIAGHIDTVPINNNVPTTTEVRDSREWIVGRGTVDMKAGVAVQLSLAALIHEPSVDVTWVWYDNEEVASALNGLGRVSRNHPEWLTGDFAILGEPTAANVEGGCNGTTRFLVKTSGTRAHSARAWVGHNAIHDLAPALDVLRDYTPATVEVDGLAYREGLNAVTITGGVAGNVIPDEAVMQVNYRFAPDKSTEDVEALIHEWFAGYELEIIDMSPGARPGLDDPFAQGFLDSVKGEVLPKYGWTDVARFSSLGIPAVNYGPGNALKAHADDEAVDTTEITVCYTGLHRWLTA